MQRFRWLGIVLLIPALIVTFSAVGCGDKNKGKKAAAIDDDDDDDTGKKAAKKNKKTAKKGEDEEGSEDKKTEKKETDGGEKDKKDGGDEGDGGGELTELKSTGWGTLKGKVTLEGTLPSLESPKAQMEAHDHKKTCLAGDTSNQTWTVKDKAVKNVVIWLTPGPNKFFKLPPKDQWDPKWTAAVQVDQPNCAFIPHVSVAWPQYRDAKTKKLVPSGQIFEVLNSAEVAHNSRITGGFKNPTKGATIPAKSGAAPDKKEFKINPDTVPLTLVCDVHKWMSAKVWAFDHPYAAVTKADGTYEIKNVPTGVDLNVVVWHEGVGFVNGSKGTKKKLEKDTKMDFTIKAPSK